MRRRWRPPLRVPKTAHTAGDRLVPVRGCGCGTCVAERNRLEGDAEAAHWQRVGELLGIDDPAGADPGRAARAVWEGGDQ